MPFSVRIRGSTLILTNVLEFPLSEFCSRYVNCAKHHEHPSKYQRLIIVLLLTFEFLYGICLSLFSLFSPSAAMTSPRALKLLFILCVSRSRSLWFPAPLAFNRSLPARSTRFSAPSHAWPVCVFVPRMRSVNTECEREERSFIRVAATMRREFAIARSERTWAGERSCWTTTSVTRVDPFSCLISCFFLSNSPFPRRSLIVSLYCAGS